MSAAGFPLWSEVSVGDELPRLGVDVTPTTVVLGAIASRDWRPMHHDYRFATERNGVQDIFLNTPNQAAWFERYCTDWSGPRGRLGRMTFRMRSSVFPGDRMEFRGLVTATSTDAQGCGWVDLDVTLVVVGAGGADASAGTEAVAADEKVATTCTVRLALPVDADDNPWTRSGANWAP